MRQIHVFVTCKVLREGSELSGYLAFAQCERVVSIVDHPEQASTFKDVGEALQATCAALGDDLVDYRIEFMEAGPAMICGRRNMRSS